MDLKTFEYMGERVSKAKKLIDRIKFYNSSIELIKDGVHFYDLQIASRQNTRGIVPDYDNEELFETLKPALIEAYTKKRDELQNELDQL